MIHVYDYYLPHKLIFCSRADQMMQVSNTDSSTAILAGLLNVMHGT